MSRRAAPDQALQERGPERFRLGRADVQADDLAPALGIDRHGDYCRHGHDPPALTLLQVGGVQPEVGPLATERAIQEGVHALVDVLAELANLALVDPGETHGLGQFVHAPGRDAANPGFLDHSHQGLLRCLPGLQEGREVGRPGPELRDTKLERAEPGVERPVAKAVAVRLTLRRPLVPGGADHAFHVGLHQQLQDGFGHGAQEIAITGLLQQFDQWQSLVGHRTSSWSEWKLRNSTLDRWSDGHLALTPSRAPNFHHLHRRYLPARHGSRANTRPSTRTNTSAAAQPRS